jgi:excisionase family DNA binding protein
MCSKRRENLKAASPRYAAERLGVSVDTLRRWHARGLISASRTMGGHYRYDLEEYLQVLEEIEWGAGPSQ